MIERGEIYDYDFGPIIDRRQAGRRPAVVVQTDLIHVVRNYGLTIVVPLTTKGIQVPSQIPIAPSPVNGLSSVSYAKCEQPYTIMAADLSNRRGKLDDADLAAVMDGLRYVFELYTDEELAR